MGFMDKIKEAAQDVAKGAKSATATAQSKMETSKDRKKADGLAAQLGYLIYRERTQGTPAGKEADDLVTQISTLETEIAAEEAELAAKKAALEAQDAANEPPAAAPAPPPADSLPPEGDAKP